MFACVTSREVKAEEGVPEAAGGVQEAAPESAAAGPSAMAEAEQPSPPPDTAPGPEADGGVVMIADVAADVGGEPPQHAAAGASEAVAAPEDPSAAGTVPMDTGEAGGESASGEPTQALETPVAEE